MIRRQHWRAFHYKGLMCGIVPVYMDNPYSDEPVLVGRHWSLMPALLLLEGAVMLFNAVAALFVEDWEGGMPIKVTAYFDPPVMIACWEYDDERS